MKAARLHPPKSRTDQAQLPRLLLDLAAPTTQRRTHHFDTPLYDGHIEKRINVNRCHLNPQHNYTKSYRRLNIWHECRLLPIHVTETCQISFVF